MSVKVSHLVKKFGDTVAVDDVSFNVEPGILLTLLGPSGCGKTTTLRCIAGLEKPTSGEVWIDDVLVFSDDKRAFVPPHMRWLSMVFQSYAIWPHMTVFENVAYGLKIKKLSKNDVKKKVEEALKLVDLSGFQSRYPSQLSGGQQQRVALARSIAVAPKVLLLDEPLSNLDAKLRDQMRLDLKKLLLELGITSIYVTHDQLEAMTISDRIIVMNKGIIEQIGTPTQIYSQPESPFVADFVGVTSIVKGEILEEQTEREDGLIGIAEDIQIRSQIPREIGKGEHVNVVLRPEYLRLAKERAKDANVFESKIEAAVYLGDKIEYHVLLGQEELRIHSPPSQVFKEGEKAYIYIEKCNILRQNE